MSLTTKIILIAIIGGLLHAALDQVVQRRVVFPSFAAAEREEAREDVARCLAALQAEINRLASLSVDRAASDALYQAVGRRDLEDVASSLSDAAFQHASLNLVHVIDESRDALASRAVTLPTLEPMEIATFSGPRLAREHPLCVALRHRAEVAGLVATEHGPMAVAAAPILTSAHVGPRRGTLVLGRLLEHGFLESISHQTGTVVQVISEEQAARTLGAEAVQALGSPGGELQLDATNSGLLYAHRIYRDISGAPELVLRVAADRNIIARGRAVTGYVLSTQISRSLVGVLILLVLVKAFVVYPLTDLARKAADISDTGDLTQRLNLRGRDEIAALAGRFDAVLERLEENQRRLRDLNAELLETEERARRRVAGMLHDGVAQTLAAAKLKLQSVEEQLDDDRGAEELREALEDVDESLRGIRTMAFELSPPVLHELGLAAALRWLVEQSPYNTLHCQVSAHGLDSRLPGRLEAVLFAATRELLTNAVKHSQASRVALTVKSDAELAIVEVTDDGVGFDSARALAHVRETSGFGLLGIRERLSRAGGSLNIHSAPGGGTRAVITAPIDDRDDGSEESRDEH